MLLRHMDATYHNIKIGQISDIATYSFYPGKNLVFAGDEAVAIITNKKKLIK